jgi:hypothetical protein
VTGIYYVEAADWLRSAGLTVVEVKGWQTRARSSGGFAAPPLGIQWHHTASKTTPENDTNWQYFSSSDAPIGNMTIMRDGVVWIGAAGAANTAGKGGPMTMSRGTVPVDGANSRTWAFEVANNGVGEPWPQVQIDAYFAASNELNRRFGNSPRDVFTHAINTSTAKGWTDRKIDPATAAAVQGPWRPRSVNSSGTWNLDDIRDECARRATAPTPTPPDPTPEPEDDEMARLYLAKLDTNAYHVRRGDGNVGTVVRSSENNELKRRLDAGQAARPGGAAYYSPTTDKAIAKWADIPSLSETALDLDVGYLVVPASGTGVPADEG